MNIDEWIDVETAMEILSARGLQPRVSQNKVEGLNEFGITINSFRIFDGTEHHLAMENKCLLHSI